METTPLVAPPSSPFQRQIRIYNWRVAAWKYILLSIFIVGLVVAVVVLALILPAHGSGGLIKMYCYEHYACSLAGGCTTSSSLNFQFPQNNSDYIYWEDEDVFKCVSPGGLNCNYTWNDCISATKSEKKIKFCSQSANNTDIFYYAWCFNVPSALVHQSRYCNDDSDYKRPPGERSCL